MSLKQRQQLASYHLTPVDFNKPNVLNQPINSNKQDCNVAKEDHEEKQYLNLIQKILSGGETREDRTGVGTLAIFGEQMKFSLRDGVIPLLTTKRVFWKGVVEELIWFIAGCTDATKLSEKGVHIWDENGSREFLDKCGFHDRETGDLGPIYGFQWRHWGAKYVDHKTDYSGQGVDQLMECIEKIKNKQTDRRIMLSAWNVGDLNQMALPPVCLQFFNLHSTRLTFNSVPLWLSIFCFSVQTRIGLQI